MTKQELLNQYLSEPIKAGDEIEILGLGSQNKTIWGLTIAEKVENEMVYYKNPSYINSDLYSKPITECRKATYKIGYNPFPEKDWNANIRFIGFDLANTLSSCGYDRREKTFKNEIFGEVIVPELNWNPVIINDEGEEISYQRDFVWSLKDKQLLIDSIYNNIEIGKIVVRKRSWNWVENRIKKGQIKNTAFKDIVDGKQRLNALFDFIQDKYPDSNGYVYSELSNRAQRKFENFSSLSYGEIGESASDKDVKSIFLNINFAGIPMSQEHIEFVKSIKI